MTHPSDGEAFITLHVDGDRVTPEMEEIVRRSSEQVERTAGPKAGENIGSGVATGIEKELERPEHGSEIARAVERSLSTEHVNSSHLFQGAERDVEGAARTVAEDFIQAFEEAVTSGGGNGKGPFSFLGTAITDAFSAGFNVPAKSPLIAFLVPAFGALADVIGSAVVAVEALGAALAAIPSLIGAISLEAGTLYLIFHSTFKEFIAAYNAQNAKDFQKAIEGLTLPAQKFATEFIPAVHKFFHDLEFFAQYNFFWRLGSVIIPGVITQLTRELGPAVAQIASGFGYLAQQLGIFLSNQDVAALIKDIGVAAGNFIANSAPALVKLLDGFTKFADKMLPFATTLGTGFLKILGQIGDFFGKLADNPKFQQWLNDMVPILGLVGDVLKSAGDLLIAFFDTLNQAGGKSLLSTLVWALNQLATFFASPVGEMFMKELIIGINTLTVGFVGLVIIIGSLLSVIGGVWYGIKGVADAVSHFFSGLSDWFDGLKKDVSDWFHHLAATATGFPQVLRNAIGDLSTLLVHAGESLITGFINGMKNMFGSAVGAAKGLLSDIADLFPHSPAKKGPFSGKGHTFYSGQALMNDFAKGMEVAAGTVTSTASTVMSSIVFGPGSVNVNFEGSEAPTYDEARITGSAVGAGITQQLATRDAALAVRTL